MKRGLDLFLLILAVGLSTLSVDAKDVVGRNNAEIHHTKKANDTSTYPSSRAYLYSIYPPGESGVNVFNSSPQTNSETESQDDSFDSLVINEVVQTYASSYLMLCEVIKPSLSIKELIFPFHSFL